MWVTMSKTNSATIVLKHYYIVLQFYSDLETSYAEGGWFGQNN